VDIISACRSDCSIRSPSTTPSTTETVGNPSQRMVNPGARIPSTNATPRGLLLRRQRPDTRKDEDDWHEKRQGNPQDLDEKPHRRQIEGQQDDIGEIHGGDGRPHQGACSTIRFGPGRSPYISSTVRRTAVVPTAGCRGLAADQRAPGEELLAVSQEARPSIAPLPNRSGSGNPLLQPIG